MNILDENVREDQRGLLQSWGIPVQQIGVDVGRKGKMRLLFLCAAFSAIQNLMKKRSGWGQ